MKREKRISAALLTFLMLCSFASCHTSENEIPDVSSEETSSVTDEIITYEFFRLPYNHTASLNPLVTESGLNFAVSALVAETLTLPKGDGTAALVLASSVESSDTFRTYTVGLKDVSFSDGTPVTASDVIASAEQIRSDTKSLYHTRLENVGEMTASEDGTSVVFSLLSPDPCFAAMLSFPIVKGGSTDETFLGTGAYILSFSEEGVPSLSANENYRNGAAETKRIELTGTDKASALHYLLSSGTVDAYYTEHPAKTSGSFSAAECLTQTEGFLSFPGSDGLCADRNFRSLLLRELNVEKLIEDTGLYAASSTRMDSLFKGTGSQEEQTDKTEATEIPEETETTEETAGPEAETPLPDTLEDYLVSAGYDGVDTDGIRCRTNGRQTVSAELTLACLNTEEALKVADALTEQLKSKGLRLTVTAFETTEMLKRESHAYDMVFAEITLSPNMDLTELLSPEGLGKTGSVSWNAYRQYKEGKTDGESLNAVLQEELPFAFLYTRKGKLLYNRSFSAGVNTNAYCPYTNAEMWYLYD